MKTEEVIYVFPIKVEEFSVRFSLGIQICTHSSYVLIMYNMKEKQGLNVTRKEYSMKMQLFFVIFSYFYFVLE